LVKRFATKYCQTTMMLTLPPFRLECYLVLVLLAEDQHEYCSNNQL